MKNLIKQLNAHSIMFLVFVCFSSSITFEASAASNKIDLDAGFYSLTAKNSAGKSGNVSSLGMYRIAYRRAITPRFDIGVGYTILFTKVVTGDSGFGLDLNGSYYFLGASSLVEAKSDQGYLAYTEDLRPFISFSFAQRNYQSIQTSYAGFGGALGIEKNILERLSSKITIRYNMFSAGQNSTAKEFAVLGGITLEF